MYQNLHAEEAAAANGQIISEHYYKDVGGSETTAFTGLDEYQLLDEVYEGLRVIQRPLVRLEILQSDSLFFTATILRRLEKVLTTLRIIVDRVVRLGNNREE
jgi:hypothetical protein